MKSNVFGFSAKLALAVLAVSGTMLTSCYEEKGIDVTPVEPKPVTYIVAGGVYDAVTNAAVEGASVTTSKGSATVNGSAFRITGLAAKDVVTITVEKTGYIKATRTVEVGVGAEGTTVVVNANIALTSLDSENVPPVAPEGGANVPNASDLPNVGTSEGQAALGLGGLKAADGGVLEFDAEGNMVAMAQTEVDLAPVPFDQYVPVKVERYEDSFVITDVKEAGTKALSDVNPAVLAYLARCISNEIGVPYAGIKFNKVEDTINLLQVANKTPLAVVANITFAARSMNFVVDGVTYTVVFMSCKTTSFGFIYDTHDSHDSHDKHDGHGGNPNAGGGIGGSDL